MQAEHINYKRWTFSKQDVFDALKLAYPEMGMAKITDMDVFVREYNSQIVTVTFDVEG